MRTAWIVILSAVLTGSGAAAQNVKPANGLQTGLTGEYFNGPNFEQKAFTRTDAQVAFDWNGQTPAPGVQREYFSVRWTGKLYAPASGKYQFSATADDGVRVWVGGRQVINEWRKQDDSRFVGEIVLKAKQTYDLKVEYYNDWKGSVIYLFWKTPVDPRIAATTLYEMIPAHYLTPPPVRPAKATVAVVKPLVKSVDKPALVAAGKPRTNRIILPVQRKSGPIFRLSGQLATVVAMPEPVGNFSRLTAGETITLHNVFFGQSEYSLLPESHAELDKLLRALQASSSVQVEVAGHTDNVGDPRLNVALSENRAKVVAHYLTRRGIAPDRITAKGYGGARPVADNKAEDGRGRNRRVEVTVR